MSLVHYTASNIAKSLQNQELIAVENVSVTVKDLNDDIALIYSDSTGTLLVNPFTTGNSGMFDFWVEAGEYIVETEKGGSTGSIQIDLRAQAFAYQLTTTDLIGSTATFTADTNIPTSGFTTSGDGGAGSWIQNGVTGQTPSQSPAQLGDALLNDGNGNQWAFVFSDKLNLNAIGMNIAESCGAVVSIGFKKIRDSYTLYGSKTLPHMPLVITAKPGTYFTEESINAQLLDGQSWEVRFDGVVIVGKVTGKTVIDLLGSRFGKITGLKVIGDSSATPAIGIQYGRLEATISADNLQFINVKTTGLFSFTAVYNLASETEYWEQLELYNSYDGDDLSGFCHVFDGNNTFGAITDFTSPTMAQYEAMSCIQHTFVSPDWRKVQSSGPAMFMTGTWQFKSINGYIVCNDDHAIILSLYGSSVNNIDLDMHLETTSCLGLVRFEKNAGSANTNGVIKGFSHKDHAMQTSNTCYFVGTSLDTLSIEEADIKIHGFDTIPPNGLIVPLSKAKIQGDVYCGESAALKSFEFYGTIKTSNAELGAYGKGTYTIIDVDSGAQWHKGSHNFLVNKDVTIAANTLSTLRTIDMRNESVQFPPTNSAPAIDANRFPIAMDNGSNWSGANPTGTNRLVFHDGSGWRLITLT